MTLQRHWLMTGAAVIAALGVGFGSAQLMNRPAAGDEHAEEGHAEEGHAGEEGDVLAMTQEQAAEAEAGRYRLLLYLGSVLLAYLLARVVVQVRAHAETLRRQVALEHAMASASTRLIAAPAHRIGEVVSAALGELSAVLGARCACFLFAAENRSCFWPAPSDLLPGNWADVLVPRAVPTGDGGYGIVTMRRRTLPIGSLERQALDAAGLEGCCCIVQPARSAARNVLAFGFPAGHAFCASDQLAVLSAALDAISMAFEHANLDDERSRLEAQLSQARRMETVGSFASGIAHNFNNLLGAISGHAEIAAGVVSESRLAREHVEQIRLSAERGRQLIEGLLTFGRRHEHHRYPTDLAALLAESRDLLQAALGAEHCVSLSPTPPPTAVLADPAQLQQVVLNLCHNAAQAMPAGGTIFVDLEHRHVAEPVSTADGMLQPGAYALVAVTDTGCGISPSLLRKVYEPFFTTKASGTGLGLSTAREIVAAHGGMLSLESVRGRGTTARLWLPLMPSETSVAPMPARLHGAGECVLYVAANDRVRLRGEELLAALGYEPIGFATMAAALAALETSPARFDAILIGDVPLDRDTTALLVAARAVAPSIPRLFAIMHADDYRGEVLADAGVTAVLQFPLDPRELTLALRRSISARVRQPAGSDRSTAVGASPRPVSDFSSHRERPILPAG